VKAGTDIDFEGAANSDNFDVNGDVLTGAIEIFRITGGKFETIKVVPVSLEGAAPSGTPTAAPTGTATGTAGETPAATPAGAPPPPAGPLRIGMLFDYTGSLGEYGPNMETGAQLALKQINAAGGVLGKPVELIKADAGTESNKAVAAANQLVSVDGVQAIVGCLSSGVTISVAEGVAVPNKIVMISPASTSPALTAVKDDGFLFRTVLSDAAQGVVLAQWAIEQGYK
jgi:ABC-type branched-subunit amino acid transport system substrate-binding protein